MKNILLISASPKREGNCSSIVKNMHACLSTRVLFLCDYEINPCIDCGFCKKNHAECLLDSREAQGAQALFEEIEKADEVIFVSPIYFYHLPSQFKAFVDRGQRFWHKSAKKNKEKKIHAVFVAAREQGDKIPEGSLLTLKYFAPLVDAELCSSLCLYGLDKKDDFENSQKAQDKLAKFIKDNLHKELSNSKQKTNKND